MTAGIAATRPIAVANSASAMCGPTVLSDAADASLLSAMSRNANRMPMTVPNRPMNGAAEPVVARNGTIDSSLVVSCSLRAAQRALDVGEVAFAIVLELLVRVQLRELGVARDEHLRDGAVPQVLRLLVDLLDVARLPERFDEAAGLARRAADVEPLVDDDVQADHEHDGEQDHHGLDDPVGLIEQARDVQFRGERPG